MSFVAKKVMHKQQCKFCGHMVCSFGGEAKERMLSHLNDCIHFEIGNILSFLISPDVISYIVVYDENRAEKYKFQKILH